MITPRVHDGFESRLLLRVGSRVAPGNSHPAIADVEGFSYLEEKENAIGGNGLSD
jgi:hypothetical protein